MYNKYNCGIGLPLCVMLYRLYSTAHFWQQSECTPIWIHILLTYMCDVCISVWMLLFYVFFHYIRHFVCSFVRLFVELKWISKRHLLLIWCNLRTDSSLYCFYQHMHEFEIGFVSVLRGLLMVGVFLHTNY